MFDRAGIDLSHDSRHRRSHLQRARGEPAKAGITICPTRRWAFFPIARISVLPMLRTGCDTCSSALERQCVLLTVQPVCAPIRDTWNTDILPELAPHAGDGDVVYKHRYSGFYLVDRPQCDPQRARGYLPHRHWLYHQCLRRVERFVTPFSETTSVWCSRIVRTGADRTRLATGAITQASLLLFQLLFGWVADSNAFIDALDVQPAAAPEQGSSRTE